MTLKVPEGFRLNGVHCGIKQHSRQEDVTLLVSDTAATAAGVYTQNVIRAAAVELDEQRTPAESIRAIVVNSGNANACTGQRGRSDAARTTQFVADACGLAADQVLVMSTGIIGNYLPMERLSAGIRSAAGSLEADAQHLEAAARGMMTTDTVPKLTGQEISTSHGPVCITGLAKGSGMIAPRMATMLSVILTDAPLKANIAQRMLADVVDHSFNCVTVDGHESTNDTVLLLANGRACSGPLSDADLKLFRRALQDVCVKLARSIASDGEGATHLITIGVRGCTARAAALRIARAVANSPLVKTAVTGGDPNWGRVVSAAGYAGVDFDPSQFDVSINGVTIYGSGAPVPFDAVQLSTSMRNEFETQIVLTFRNGKAAAVYWTCDLTDTYVRINADYHT